MLIYHVDKKKLVYSTSDDLNLLFQNIKSLNWNHFNQSDLKSLNRWFRMQSIRISLMGVSAAMIPSDLFRFDT